MEEERILIVEDEPKIADTLRLGLEENGYHAKVAYDGKVAHEMFRTRQYDLIILDINLPSINGYDLCQYYRSINPHVSHHHAHVADWPE
jgi:DNA-binding response OmpR family regulator